MRSGAAALPMAIGLVMAAWNATPVMGQAFDVVSIKASDPAATGTTVGLAPGGIFQARNVTLKTLIEQAYELRNFQIFGGPGWLSTERYDLEAKGGGPALSDADAPGMSAEQRNEIQRQMERRLQTILSDRFQLKLHRDSREMPVYALVIAKGGPKVGKTAGVPGSQRGLSLRRNAQGLTDLTGVGIPLSELVWSLSNETSRVVIDKTGLNGNFDFKMTYAPDPSGPALPDKVSGDAGGPSIFTAIEEQLGLKLQPERGPVEVVVIDSVQHPSPN